MVYLALAAVHSNALARYRYPPRLDPDDHLVEPGTRYEVSRASAPMSRLRGRVTATSTLGSTGSLRRWHLRATDFHDAADLLV